MLKPFHSASSLKYWVVWEYTSRRNRECKLKNAFSCSFGGAKRKKTTNTLFTQETFQIRTRSCQAQRVCFVKHYKRKRFFSTWIFFSVCEQFPIQFSKAPRPQFAGEVWKRSFISTVIPTVHTNPSVKRRFCENRSSDRRSSKTPASHFRVDGKNFDNGVFQKQGRHDDHVISLEFSSNTNLKWRWLLHFQIS